MKKVIVLGSVVAMLFGMSSCIGRECVCKEKKDGKVVTKVIVKDNDGVINKCDDSGDEEKEEGYSYTCK